VRALSVSHSPSDPGALEAVPVQRSRQGEGEGGTQVSEQPVRRAGGQVHVAAPPSPDHVPQAER